MKFAAFAVLFFSGLFLVGCGDASKPSAGSSVEVLARELADLEGQRAKSLKAYEAATAEYNTVRAALIEKNEAIKAAEANNDQATAAKLREEVAPMQALAATAVKALNDHLAIRKQVEEKSAELAALRVSAK